MRIIFMGTPEFAVPSLAKILPTEHEVVGVVTAPDRPSGRGQKLRPSPVKAYALEQDLPVLQPVKLRDPEFLAALQALDPDLMVVVAFRMLPEAVWSLPQLGTFNLHASLLPDYRGAAPINWVIINGEEETGATTFLIDQKIDTGNLLLQRKIDLPFNWTAGDLHDRLMELGADLVLETIEGLAGDQLVARTQDDSGFLHPAPKLYKQDCKIDWRRPAEDLYNLIRGLSPFPGAFTLFQGDPVKVYLGALTDRLVQDVTPGTVEIDKHSLQMSVACQDRWLEILSLQMPGKKRLATDDFLRGFKEEMRRFES